MGQSPSLSALNIWRAYTRILLHHLDLESCLVICQEDLLNPHRVDGELRRMAEWIGTPDVDISAALAWIEPGLDHREPSKGEQLEPELDSMDQLIRDVAQTQRARFLQTELPPAPPAMEPPPERCIYIVSPTRYGHSEAFSEIAQALHFGMASLGVEAPIVRDSWDIRGTPVVLGAHLLLDYPQRNPLPDDAILYNLEQVDPDSDHFPQVYLDLLRRYRIWDYSPRNIEQLESMGVPDAQLCQIGFAPELVRIPDRAHQDIDVLFYGSLNPRRRRVLNQLNEQGLKVMVLQGIYGAERDAWIARSKIVLNIHYFEAKVLEVVRLSYLLSNRRFVISERGKDTSLEAPYEHGMVLDSYEMLVPQVMTWIQNPAARQAVAAEGQRLFAQRDQAAWLRPLLGLEPKESGQ
jgi:hypothetical protein